MGLTHVLLNGVISNDLEWLSEIFNDTKNRAVSATAELLVLLYYIEFMANKYDDDVDDDDDDDYDDDNE